MNEITIKNELLKFDRNIYQQDVEEVIRLVAQVGVFSQEEILIAGELVSDKLSGDDESYNFIFLRDSQKKIVAYSCFGEICLAKDRYDLYWIAVSKKYQNQKLATLILNKTEVEIKKLGGKKIYAETSSVTQYKPARNFYLKSGFTKVAEILDFYKDGDNKVIFCKNL